MAPKKSCRRSESARNGAPSMKLKKLLRRRPVLCKPAILRMMRKELKKQVREEVKKEVRKILRDLNSLPGIGSTSGSSLNQAESSGQRRLWLHFVYKVPGKLFTAQIISADGAEVTKPVRVELHDENNNVVNEGPLSSLKIEVFVVDGDLKSEESEGWKGKEVETSRVHARKERASLLVGNCIRTMENGVCSFDDLKFVDNSSWVSSKKFRLVARVSESAQVSDMVEIRVAVSGPFRVKDQRGKPYEKHPVPSLDDEIWRLEKIGRNGPYHVRLDAEGIKTVKDFLQEYYINQSSLCKILGVKNGAWETIVQHAKKCYPNNEHFLYGSERANLLFNCFYELVHVSFDHQNYHSLETLDEYHKSCVAELRDCAFKDRTKLTPISLPAGRPSDDINSWMVPYQSSQDPIVPPLQVDPTAVDDHHLVADHMMQNNDVLLNCPSYPEPSPLLLDRDIQHHQPEEPDGQTNSAMKDILPFLRSDSLMQHSLMLFENYLPSMDSMPSWTITADYLVDEHLFSPSSSMPREREAGRVWYRARAAIFNFLVASRRNRPRMVTARSCAVN